MDDPWRNQKNRTPVMILIADDDPDDCLLAQKAMSESLVANDLRFVHDGELLMDYLHCRGKYSG